MRVTLAMPGHQTCWAFSQNILCRVCMRSENIICRYFSLASPASLFLPFEPSTDLLELRFRLPFQCPSAAGSLARPQHVNHLALASTHYRPGSHAGSSSFDSHPQAFRRKEKTLEHLTPSTVSIRSGNITSCNHNEMRYLCPFPLMR